MKKLTLAIVAAFALTSCTKDREQAITDNKVEYIINCEKCSVTMDVLGGKKTVEVTDYFLRAEINTLPIINIVTEGEGEITVKMKVDNVEVYNQTNKQVLGTPIKHTIKR